MTIGQPYYEPTSNEEEEEEEIVVDEETDTGDTGVQEENEEVEDVDTDMPELNEDASSEPVKSGCSTVPNNSGIFSFLIAMLALVRRKK